MVQRIAGSMALIAFTLCLVMGIVVENDFATTVWRGLTAMGATFFIGLIVGSMAQRMLAENLSDVGKKKEIDQSPPTPRDR